ncbi:ABC transporter permease [Chloroflexota bacterium]
MKAIFRKELIDNFNSIRFAILFALVFLGAAGGLYAAQDGIRVADPPSGFIFLALYTTSGQAVPSLVFFLNILVPIIGITLGFDAINSERNNGTLSRIIAQPIYRDSVINGKLLAGVATLSIMVFTTLALIAGFGLRMIGVPPTTGEIIRLFIYGLITVVYGAFWMELAIMFSILFRKIAASLLVSIFVWLFFTFFMFLIAPAIANMFAPVNQASSTAELLNNVEIQQVVMMFSPSTLYDQAVSSLLLPVTSLSLGSIGAVVSGQTQYMLPNPLSLGQSLLAIWPHLTTLISLTLVCFGGSYLLFMRQEVRAT